MIARPKFPVTSPMPIGPGVPTGRSGVPRQAPVGRSPRSLILGSMKKGGKVKKTGLYKLHSGEKVVPLSSLRRAR